MIHIFRMSSKISMKLALINTFYFSGLPSNFLKNNQQQSKQIISLTNQEIEQLTNLNYYQQSVQFLKVNRLQDSLNQLEFALSESKDKFPWSINLQCCLLSRMSILTKLLNKKVEFEEILEQIYLINVSSKSSRSLDTIKSLINYLICLTVNNKIKCDSVLSFLSQSQQLPDYLLFFDALNDIRVKGKYDEGIQKLSNLPQDESYEKIFKLNNTGFLKYLCLREKYKNSNQYATQIKIKSEQILETYLRAFLQAQKNPQQLVQYSQQQILQHQKQLNKIDSYLKGQLNQLPKDILISKKILKNSNSHIISMNIATILFQVNRTKQCFYFLKLSIDKAINDQELQRVGIALTLLGRCYYLDANQKWEKTFLGLLDNSKTYPKIVIKQALLAYSKLLFQQERFYEAENYLNQSISIDGEGGIEGLILPSYDFSF